MKKIFFILLFSFFSIFAQDNKSIFQIIEKKSNCILEISNDKFYIDPEFITIDEKGIKLNLENASVSINTLYCDNKGIYLKDDMWPMPFICERCGRLNSGFNFVCENCGLPRND